MFLSAELIRELLEALDDGTPHFHRDRLAITPILDVDAQLAPGTASVDIRLGQEFRIPKRTKLSKLDHFSDSHSRDIEKYKDESFVPIGDFFVLHPRQFVLGVSLEWVRLPSNLMAFVVGKSSLGRDGLVIATATGVHPHYSGVLTLEISNIGEIPIYLHPGMLIAQLFISTVKPGEQMIQDWVPSEFAVQVSPRSQSSISKDRDIIQAFNDPSKCK